MRIMMIRNRYEFSHTTFIFEYRKNYPAMWVSNETFQRVEFGFLSRTYHTINKLKVLRNVCAGLSCLAFERTPCFLFNP